MTLARFIHNVIRPAGIKLVLAPGRIRWHAPPGAVTQDVLDNLRRFRPRLLVTLDATRPWPERVDALIADLPDRAEVRRRYDEWVDVLTLAGLPRERAEDIAADEVHVPAEVVA